MSVNVRPYKKGGWEVDIMITLANGDKIRRRFKAPVSSKSGARRWGEQREQHLVLEAMGRVPTLDDAVPAPASDEPRATPATEPATTPSNHQPQPTREEVPTLAAFAPRYLDGYARANREKPSSIAAKESILRVHLIPRLGNKPLDALEQEDIQRLKAELAKKSSKTVNNVLTVLNTLLQTAVEWKLIRAMPVRIRLLKVTQRKLDFYDFDEYEALVTAAGKCDPQSLLVVLLGGEAGLRRGEMMALEWTDVDFRRRLLTVERSDWKGHVTTPKGGRLRTVPMTARLTAALQQHRHLRGPRVLCQEDGKPGTAKILRGWLGKVQRRANLRIKGPHTLRHTFCSHLAMRGAPARAIQDLAGHRHLTTTQRYMHLSPAALQGAIALLEPGGQHADAPVSTKLLETPWRRGSDPLNIQ